MSGWLKISLRSIDLLLGGSDPTLGFALGGLGIRKS